MVEARLKGMNWENSKKQNKTMSESTKENRKNIAKIQGHLRLRV